MSWFAAAASVTGSAHEKSGLPCQDSCAYELHDGLLYGAVSDGAGSASHAHDGAHFAVAKAIALLKEQSWPRTPPQQEFWRFSASFHVGVRDELAARAKEQDCAIENFACTLLAFVASPSWLAAIQIGDGLLVVRAPHARYELLFKPDRGEYFNETTFVTSPDSFQRAQTMVWPYRPEFLCASSDGIERVALKLKDWTPHEPFFKTLDEYIQTKPDAERGAKDVAEFLSRDKLRQKTDDDTSLLLGACLAS